MLGPFLSPEPSPLSLPARPSPLLPSLTRPRLPGLPRATRPSHPARPASPPLPLIARHRPKLAPVPTPVSQTTQRPTRFSRASPSTPPDRPAHLPRGLQPLTCIARPRLPLADPSGPPASALPHVSPRQRGPPASHRSPCGVCSTRSLTRKAHPVSAPLLPSFFFPAVKPAPLLRSVAPRRHSLPRGPPQLRRAYRPASPSVSPSRSFPTQARRSRAAVVRSTLGTDHGRNCRSRF